MRPAAQVCCAAVPLLAALAAPTGWLLHWPADARPVFEPAAVHYPGDEEAHAYRHSLDERGAAVRSRIAERVAVAAAARRGDISLDEAAARFRELNAEDPASRRHMQTMYPQATEDELSAWQVVQHARPDRRADPTRAESVGAARLADEYRRRFPGGPPVRPFEPAESPAPVIESPG